MIEDVRGWTTRGNVFDAPDTQSIDLRAMIMIAHDYILTGWSSDLSFKGVLPLRVKCLQRRSGAMSNHSPKAKLMGVDNQEAMIGTQRERCRTDMYGDY